MGNYTRHGAKVLVPELKGLTLAEAEDILGDRALKAVVIDSIFTDKVPRGTVFAHTPGEGHEVKPDRKIYITMNASTKKLLKMPDLMNQSERQAISMLQLIGLKVGKVDEREDQCDGCVIEQLHKGKKIEPGDMIRQGERIDLVLGSGLDKEYRLDEEVDGKDEDSSQSKSNGLDGVD